MSQINMTTPGPAIGTPTIYEATGFKVQNLGDIPNAYVEVQITKKTDLGNVVGRFWHPIKNGGPLRSLTGIANETSDDYATQLYTTIVGAIGNPKDEIEAWLVTNGVISGTAV